MRACILVLLAFASYANAVINLPGCGQGTLQPDNNGKVVNGKEAKAGEIPWQIQLFRSNSFTCGGSLINQQWILTAAHCISTNPASQFSVRLGHTDRINPESWSITRSIIFARNHPSYSSLTYRNDISLLKMASPVTFNAYISPICLDTGKKYSGKNFTSSGWGNTAYGGTVSNKLLWVSLSMTSDVACRESYGGAVLSYDSTTMICAGDIGDSMGPCQGDSGGPLAIYDTEFDPNNDQSGLVGPWVNVGVVSWGRGCGDIGVYARVSTYIQWIISIISNN